MNISEDRFDAKYSTNPKAFGLSVPVVVEKAVKLAPGKKALELGVGDGRNAKYLLEQGLLFQVDEARNKLIASYDTYLKEQKNVLGKIRKT